MEKKNTNYRHLRLEIDCFCIVSESGGGGGGGGGVCVCVCEGVGKTKSGIRIVEEDEIVKENVGGISLEVRRQWDTEIELGK